MKSANSSYILCYCSRCENKTTLCTLPNYCVSVLDFKTKEITLQCSESSKIKSLSCNRTHINELGNQAYSFCCSHSVCNRKQSIPKRIFYQLDEQDGFNYLIPTTVLAMFALVYVFVSLLRFFKIIPLVPFLKRCWYSLFISSKLLSKLKNRRFTRQEQLRRIAEIELTGTSEAGSAMVFRYSIARDVKLADIIGQGKFGTVFKADYLGDIYAVKIMPTLYSEEWDHEITIMRTVTGHPSICSYHASDIAAHDNDMHLWIILDYKENHSLYEYLMNFNLELTQALRMIKDITSGVAYLHRSLSYIRFKPSIVHRDLKSKNILVDAHMKCSVSDFGLAMSEIKETGFQSFYRDMQPKRLNIQDIDENKKINATSLNYMLRQSRNMQVGTIRYMAPELLTMAFNVRNFWNYQMIDMYSMGLVIWEIANKSMYISVRDSVSSISRSEYKLPYHEKVGRDPTILEMAEIVVNQKFRPNQALHWSSNKIYGLIFELMEDLWHENPCRRINASSAQECAECILNHHKNQIRSNLEG